MVKIVYVCCIADIFRLHIYFYFYVHKFLIPFFIVFYQFKRLNYVQYAISNVIRMLFCSQVIVLSYFLLPITILGRDTINTLDKRGSWKSKHKKKTRKL